MKLLKCRVCDGEMELNSDERGVVRHARCLKCGYCGECAGSKEKREPEVVVIRRRRD